jgi:hypothetical protein
MAVTSALAEADYRILGITNARTSKIELIIRKYPITLRKNLMVSTLIL